MSQNRRMLKQRLRLALATAGVVGLCVAPARALSLGAGSGRAVLGQSLDFAIAVQLNADEALAADCLQAEVMLGDRSLLPSQLQVHVDAIAPNLARVRVMSSVAVDEPVVALVLTAACGPPAARRYVVFADPPVSTAPFVPVPDGVESAAQSGWPSEKSAPLGSAAERRNRGTAVTESVPVPAGAWRSVALRQPAAGASANRRARTIAPSKAQSGVSAAPKQSVRRMRTAAAGLARLRVDIAEPILAIGGAVDDALQAVAQATAAARQAASAASAAADRIAALERTIDQMRGEVQSSRSQVASLHGQLARADAPAAGWVLGAAAAALALLATWLGLRLAAQRRSHESAWQSATSDAQLASSAVDAAQRPPTAAMAFVHSDLDAGQIGAPKTRPAPAWPPPAPADGWAPSEPHDAERSRQQHASSEPQKHPAEQHEEASSAKPAPANQLPAQVTVVHAPLGRDEQHAARAVSIDELLDLEQQAEFFVVLGQDDAAVELLVDHLRHTGGASPLPYLKLLEIHSRRGERSDYERMRARFNHRFNAYAPEWEVDLHSGRSLSDYPGVLASLEQAWSRPLESMSQLEGMVFHKSQGALFELPAYRELLFLYALSRDLVDRESAQTGEVDLLLPLPDGADFSITSPMPFMDLGRATQQSSNNPVAALKASVDLDLSLGGERQSSIFDPLQETPTNLRTR